MNYIAYLKSLPEDQLKIEIEAKIKSYKDTLMRDRARTSLLEENNPFAWDEIDEFELVEFTFDEAGSACVVVFAWESCVSGEEDDERSMYGNGTARVSEDGSVKFSDVSASLHGDVAKSKRSSGDDFDEDEPDEEREQREQDEQDEQDYAEYLTKDW